MTKNNETSLSEKKAIKKMVVTNLESLLVKINPAMGDKVIKQKIKKAGKILVKGIKAKKIKPAPEMNKSTPAN